MNKPHLLLVGFLAISLFGCDGNSLDKDKETHIRSVYGQKADAALKLRSNIEGPDDCVKLYEKLVSPSNRKNIAAPEFARKTFSELFHNRGSEIRVKNLSHIDKNTDPNAAGIRGAKEVEKLLNNYAGMTSLKGEFLQCLKENPIKVGGSYVSTMLGVSKANALNRRLTNNTGEVEVLVQGHLAMGKLFAHRFGNTSKEKYHFDRARYYLSGDFLKTLPEGSVKESKLKGYVVFLNNN